MAELTDSWHFNSSIRRNLSFILPDTLPSNTTSRSSTVCTLYLIRISLLYKTA